MYLDVSQLPFNMFFRKTKLIQFLPYATLSVPHATVSRNEQLIFMDESL